MTIRTLTELLSFRFFFISSLLLFSIFQSNSLEADSNYPLQISLLDPLQLVDESDNVSGIRINLIYGANQKVHGLDLGIVNRILETGVGFQGGLVNLVSDRFYGFQLGGVNYAGGGWFQLGPLNLAGGSLFQAGIANYSKHVARMQIGFVNWGPQEELPLERQKEVRSQSSGFQIGGFLNYSEGISYVQLSPVNISRKSFLQLGAVNFADREARIQLSLLGSFQVAGRGFQFGPLNHVFGSFKGVQAGLFNYSEEFAGLQIGAFNHSKKTGGLVLGLFNSTTRLKGCQIGLLNLATGSSLPLMPLVNCGWGQESGVEFTPLQFSLFAPVQFLPGSRTVHGLKFNLVYGYNRRVIGLDFGLLNHSEDIIGIQLGGANIADDSRGLHIALLYNNVLRARGLQVSVLFNYHEYASGLQPGGLFNFVSEDFSGLQIGGVFNYVDKKVQGVQFGALGNLAGDTRGVQLAGVFNITFGDLRGGQISAFFNLAPVGSGFQAALVNLQGGKTDAQIGGVNIAGGSKLQFGVWNFSGDFRLQVGLVNVGRNSMNDLSFSIGGVNYAKEINGLQIGIMNISEETNGVSIGIVNRANRLNGVQIGVLNYAMDAKIPMTIGFNAHFK